MLAFPSAGVVTCPCLMLLSAGVHHPPPRVGLKNSLYRACPHAHWTASFGNRFALRNSICSGGDTICSENGWAFIHVRSPLLGSSAQLLCEQRFAWEGRENESAVESWATKTRRRCFVCVNFGSVPTIGIIMYFRRQRGPHKCQVRRTSLVPPLQPSLLSSQHPAHII